MRIEEHIMASKSTRSGRDADHDLYSVQENVEGNSNIPAFLMKLWTLVEDPSTDELICWDVSGKSFHIFDQSRFAREVLPFYFKHNNISSFIRQLNMYGFRKVVHVEQGGLKVEIDDLEFQHAYFQRGQIELLDLIKRKVKQQAAQMRVENHALTLNPDEMSKVLTDVTQLRGKQENLSSTLVQLKRENEALWREVASLRQKHAKQQQIVNKLIHFLMSIVGGRRGMPGLKRKMPLMISDSCQASNRNMDNATPPKVARVVDSSIDHDYTVQSPSSSEFTVSATIQPVSGLIIHELLESSEVDSNDHESNILNKTASPAEIKLDSDQYLNQAAVNPEPVTVTVSLLDQALLSADILPSAPIEETKPSEQRSTTTNPPLLSEVSTLPQNQQPAKESTQKPNTGQVALRQSDKQISSTIVADKLLPVSKDVMEQLDILQSNIDNLKDVLSSGQYNIDTNFLLGLFDPQSPLPVNLDFSDTLADDVSEPTSSSLSGNITGNELWPYQPPEPLPDLFDLGTFNSPLPADDEEPPVFFAPKDSILHTPKPHTTDKSPEDEGSSAFSITAEELD